jgi:hypothetical protein
MIRHYLLLLLLFFAGDRLGGYVLEREVMASQFRFSRLYDGRAAADVLLLGNSRGLTFYQPHIESITGKTTCNLSYNGLPMDVAEALVLDYLDRYPAPQKLLIDITLCDRENDALLTGFLCYGGLSQRLHQLVRQKSPEAWWGAQVSHLYRYNHELFQRALFYRNRSDADWLLDRAIAPEQAAQASQHSYDLQVQDNLIQSLVATVAAARAKGVAIALVIGPYCPGFQVPQLDALKQVVMQRTGLPVHDYRAALPDASDFGDYMHPNKKGSVVYLDLLRRDGILP